MITIIRHFRELWRHRALIECLVQREVAVRYRGSALGYLWTLANPLLLLAVYSLVFRFITRAIQMPRYELFLFTGILPWLWLTSSLSNGVGSIVHGANLVTRACVPPQVLPAVSVLSNLVNFLFALPVALAAVWVAGEAPTPALLWLPVLILLELAFLYGVTLLLATWAVPLRDMQFLVQNAVLIGFFVTPIAWPLAMAPAGLRAWMVVNPAASLIVPFQRVLLEHRSPEPEQLLLSTGWALAAIGLAVLSFESSRDGIPERL